MKNKEGPKMTRRENLGTVERERERERERAELLDNKSLLIMPKNRQEN